MKIVAVSVVANPIPTSMYGFFNGENAIILFVLLVKKRRSENERLAN